jgi:hypothetical protein
MQKSGAMNGKPAARTCLPLATSGHENWRYHRAVAAVEIPRKIWTREETHSLADLGFTNAAELELIDGELIDHTGKKHRHVLWQHLIFAWLVTTFGTGYARSESPIDVSAADNGSIVKYGFNDNITPLAKPDAFFCVGRL